MLGFPERYKRESLDAAKSPSAFHALGLCYLTASLRRVGQPGATFPRDSS